MALYVREKILSPEVWGKIFTQIRSPIPPPSPRPPKKKLNRRPLRECSVRHNEEQKSRTRVVVEVSFQYNIGLRDQD